MPQRPVAVVAVAVAVRPRTPNSAQRRQDAALQPLQVFSQRKTMPPQRYDGVDGQLARTVQEAAAAPVDPADLDLPALHQAAAAGHRGGRAAPADRNHRRVFAQQQGDLAVVAAADVADQSPLEFQAPGKLDLPQQERLDRGRRRRNGGGDGVSAWRIAAMTNLG